MAGDGSSFTALQIKVSFSFTVYQGKVAGLSGIDYEVSVTKDYLTMDLESVVTGTAQADTVANARANIATLLTALGFTEPSLYQDQDGERLGNYVYTNTSYLVLSSLGFVNSMWVMIIPGAVNTFLLIITRSFLDTLPEEIEESPLLTVRMIFRLCGESFYPYPSPFWRQLVSSMPLISGTRFLYR